MNTTIISIAALFGAAAPAAAQAPNQTAAAPRPISRADFATQADNAFATNDTNHDGFISLGEMQAAQARDLQRVQGAARAKLQAEFKALDTNHDGQLSVAEFVAVARIRANQTPEQALQQLDPNHDGKISAAEFRASRLQQFEKADTNHDGIVTPQEATALQGRR